LTPVRNVNCSNTGRTRRSARPLYTVISADPFSGVALGAIVTDSGRVVTAARVVALTEGLVVGVGFAVVVVSAAFLVVLLTLDLDAADPSGAPAVRPTSVSATTANTTSPTEPRAPFPSGCRRGVVRGADGCCTMDLGCTFVIGLLAPAALDLATVK
jgi:hypothetical protein